MELSHRIGTGLAFGVVAVALGLVACQENDGTEGSSSAAGGAASTGGQGPGGADEGTGGDEAGTGGADEGTGGDEAGTGGADEGTGGDEAGTGGTDAGGTGGSVAGTGGTDAGTGGTDLGTGGTDAGTGGSVAECGPLDHERVAAVVVEDVDWVLRQGIERLSFAEGSALLARLGGGDPEEAVAFRADAIDGVTDVVDFLGQMVFVTGNLVGETEGAVDYAASPDVVCAPDGRFGTGSVEDEQDCRDFLAEHALRLHVTRTACEDGDSLRLELIVGGDPESTPIVFEVSPTRLAATIDLAEGADTLRALGALDEEVLLEPAPSGQIRWEVALEGESGAFVRDTLPADVVLGYRMLNDPERFAMTLAGGSVMLDLHADASTRKVTGSIDHGLMGVTMLLSDFAVAFGAELAPDADPTEIVEWSLAGMSASFSYDRATDALSITDLGLGEGRSTVRWRGQDIVTIDVNADSGRVFALDVTRNPAGDVLLGIEPGLEVVVGYAMAPVAELLVELPPFALDDTLTVRMEGESPSVRILAGSIDDVPSFNGVVTLELLAVTSGQLSLSSRASPNEDVVVPAGQCLLEADPVTGEHPILRDFAAGACP